MQTRMRNGMTWVLAVGLVVGCRSSLPYAIITIEDPRQAAAFATALAIGSSEADLQTVSLSALSFPLVITVTRPKAGVQTVQVVVQAADTEVVAAGVGQVEFRRRGNPAATIRLAKVCSSDGDCLDALFCNGDEHCVGARCVDGDLPCRSNFECLRTNCTELGNGAGACNPVADHAACGAGHYCSVTAGCVPGRACGVDVDCDDGSICNGNERCVNTICAPGTPPDVSDGDPCTADLCDDAVGARHLPDATLNGNACSVAGGAREICIAAAGGCAVSRCGDGYIDVGAVPPEQCDDGDANADDWGLTPHCNATCSGWAVYCGDGQVNAGEGCDDGNRLDDSNDCGADCQWVGTAAGSTPWRGIGNSDLGPIDVRTNLGSLSMYGVWNAYFGRHDGLAAATAPNGDIYLALAGEIEWDYPEIFVVRWDGTDWQEIYDSPVHGISNTPARSMEPTIAIDSAGQPIVAWRDESASNGSFAIFARRRVAGAWVDIGVNSAAGGGVSNTVANSFEPALTVDSLGRPVLAWTARPGNNDEIWVRRFDGATWAEVGSGSAQAGGISNTPSMSGNPVIVATPNEGLVVVWEDLSGGRQQIYGTQWTGFAWTTLGANSTSGMGISNSSGSGSSPSLAVDSSGQPVLAWEDSSGGIYVKRWSGTTWDEVGAGSATGDGISAALVSVGIPRIFGMADGKLAASWLFYDHGLGAALFDGTAWTEMGSGSRVAPGIASADDGVAQAWVGNPGEAPVLIVSTFWDQALVAIRWDDTAWQALPGTVTNTGGLSQSTGTAATPVVLLDAAGLPLVLWSDDRVGNAEICGARWDGNQWSELGASPCHAGGISATSGDSQSPTAALMPDGTLVVAWSDTTANPGPQVYLKTFTGTLWRELDHSASGTGVSQATAVRGAPALALDDQGQPLVAWQDSAGGLFVRHWTGAVWAAYEGSAPAAIDHGAMPTLAVLSTGAPVLAWVNAAADVCVRAWNGAVWSELPSGSATGGCVTNTGCYAQSPKLVADRHGGLVMVVADEFLGSQEIHAWHYDGQQWSWLDEAAYPFGNVSRRFGVSHDPAVALDAMGRPWVAWSDDSSPTLFGEVLVRRWTASHWVDVASATIESGGVSNSRAPSASPSIVVGEERACVGWIEVTCLLGDADCDPPRGQVALRCTDW